MARLMLAGWAPLRWSEFAVAGLVGSALGCIMTDPLLASPHPLDWRVLLASLGGTLAVIGLAGPVRRRMAPIGDKRGSRPTVEQMIEAGESGSVEFKSSARWNYRTSKRDE